MVEIAEKHTYITRIEKNGEIIFSQPPLNLMDVDESALNLKDIYKFANELNIEDVKDLIERQIECNIRIAQEGMDNSYGSEIGRRYLKMYGEENYMFDEEILNIMLGN